MEKEDEEVQQCMYDLQSVMNDSCVLSEVKNTAEGLKEELFQMLDRTVMLPAAKIQRKEQPARVTPEPKPIEFLAAQQQVVGYLKQDNAIAGDLKEMGKLGEGSYGKVLRGMFCGIPVALKELHPKHEEEWGKSFGLERETLMLLHHPFICEYVGYTKSPFRIVTRLYPRDVESAIAERDSSGKPTLTLEDKFRIAYQLAAALLYLHRKGLIHRDVKPKNILLDENNNVKLADFGLCEYAPGCVRDKGEFFGSPVFTAPEVLENKPFDVRCDVYSYGIVLYHIFTGRKAFAGIEKLSVLMEHKLKQDALPIGESDSSKRYGDGLPPLEFWEFAKQCWSIYPDKRPTMDRVVEKIIAIGVHSAIPQRGRAEKYWLECSSNVYRDRLLLSEFARCFPKSVNILILIKERFRFFQNHLKITDFWLLCCWFPNFFDRDDTAKQMETIIRSSWFAVDGTEARSRLIGCQKHFVIRPSTTNPFQAPFTLCVSLKNHWMFHRITRTFDQRNQQISCETFEPGANFSDICSFAKHIIDKYGLLPAETRFQCMPPNFYQSFSPYL